MFVTVNLYISLNDSKHEKVGSNEKGLNCVKSKDVNPNELVTEEEEALVHNNNGMLAANGNEKLS